MDLKFVDDLWGDEPEDSEYSDDRYSLNHLLSFRDWQPEKGHPFYDLYFIMCEKYEYKKYEFHHEVYDFRVRNMVFAGRELCCIKGITEEFHPMFDLPYGKVSFFNREDTLGTNFVSPILVREESIETLIAWDFTNPGTKVKYDINENGNKVDVTEYLFDGFGPKHFKIQKKKFPDFGIMRIYKINLFYDNELIKSDIPKYFHNLQNIFYNIYYRGLPLTFEGL